MGSKLSFVICTEKGYLEKASVLFAMTLRAFGGALASAPVFSIEPRPGRAVSRRTRDAFERLDVTHAFEPVNTTCPEYALANKPFAAAHVERGIDSEFLVFADSDQLILGEPSALVLEPGFDVGLRPVDRKEIGASGEADPNHGYWRALYEMLDVRTRSYVEPTMGGPPILSYWNSGLVTVRRSRGVFARWEENFRKVWERGLRPDAGEGYTEQSVFAATVSSMDLAVLDLPNSYNYPIQLQEMIPPEKRIDDLSKMTTAHYHRMFLRAWRRHPMERLLESDDVGRAVREMIHRSGVFPHSTARRLMQKLGFQSRRVVNRIRRSLRGAG